MTSTSPAAAGAPAPERHAPQPGGAHAAEMQIGVLLAVYARDEASAFDRALLSVLEQRLDPGVRLNVYLGVDGPIPASLEAVVEVYSERLHRVIRNPSSQGLAATLNRLIAARGTESFYFRMDADDYSLPQRFQAQLEFLRARQDVDIVGTDIIEVDKTAGTRRQVHYCDGPAHARQMICRRVPVAHPTVCLRARVFDIVGGYPNRPGNEDIAMWFTCLEAGLGFGNVALPLLEFTVAPGFWQRRGLAKSWGEFRAYVAGIRALWGWNWRLVFPLARLAVRLLPKPALQLAYGLRR